MLRVTFPIVVATSLILLAGCVPGAANLAGFNMVTGSGHIVTRNLDLAGFDSVSVAGGFQVEIKAGSPFAVAVTADDNLFDSLAVYTQGTHLNIGLKPNTGVRSSTLRATVTMPSLIAATTSGGARLTFPAYQVDSFTAETSGGSTLQGTVKAAGTVTVRHSGGSHTTLAGSAAGVRIDGSGGGPIDLANLKAGSAQVNLSGGTSATVQASDRLDYDLSGGAHLDYGGHPQLGAQHTSGGASANAR